jgi:hypothetical protein
MRSAFLSSAQYSQSVQIVLSQQGILTAPIANLSHVAQRNFSGIASTSIALSTIVRILSYPNTLFHPPGHCEQRRLNANVTRHSGVLLTSASEIWREAGASCANLRLMPLRRGIKRSLGICGSSIIHIVDWKDNESRRED